jgi:hypothetical protein
MIQNVFLVVVVLFAGSTLAENPMAGSTSGKSAGSDNTSRGTRITLKNCRFQVNGNGGSDLYHSPNLSDAAMPETPGKNVNPCSESKKSKALHVDNSQFFPPNDSQPVELFTSASTHEQFYALQFKSVACANQDSMYYIPVKSTKAVSGNCTGN